MADGSAIFHLDVSTVSRSSGRSSVAAAAYRAGTVLDDERTGQRFDYSKKKNVVDSFIVAPDGADWITDRETLWNAAEAAENRKNSTTAREWLVALPDALDATQQAELARALAVELATRFGVAVDVAIHDANKEGDKRNKHAHLLSTVRVAGPDGLAEKTRVLDAAKTGGVEIAAMREWWAGTVNDALAAAKSEARVDHRRKAVVAAEKQALAEALEAHAATLAAKPDEKLKFTAKAQEQRKDAKRLSSPPAVHRGPALNAFLRRRRAAEERKKAAQAEADHIALLEAQNVPVDPYGAYSTLLEPLLGHMVTDTTRKITATAIFAHDPVYDIAPIFAEHFPEIKDPTDVRQVRAALDGSFTKREAVFDEIFMDDKLEPAYEQLSSAVDRLPKKIDPATPWANFERTLKKGFGDSRIVQTILAAVDRLASLIQSEKIAKNMADLNRTDPPPQTETKRPDAAPSVAPPPTPSGGFDM